MSDPLEIVNKFVTAIGDGDMELALSFLSPDFVLNHVSNTPYRGTYHGREGFVELMGKIGAFWETFEPVPNPRMIVEDGELYVIGLLRGKPRHWPEKIEIRVVERYQADGQYLKRIDPWYIDMDLNKGELG